MSYRVIVDSCGELTLQMKESGILRRLLLAWKWMAFTFRMTRHLIRLIFKKSGCKRGMSEVILSIPGALYGIIQV